MANYVVLPEGEEQYGCNECGEHHASRHDAVHCCTSPNEGYKCSNCGSTHAERDDAALCCPNIMAAWICSGCGNGYEGEDEARCCCAPYPEDVEGGRYKCVVDGMAWETAEQAASCCKAGQESPSVAVESIEMHAFDCRCYDCKKKAEATPEAIMATALSAPEPPRDDDWTKALMG